MYYLSMMLVNKEKNRWVVGLSSAFFYMFNFFSLFEVWRAGTLLSFCYITVPLILGLYICLLDTGEILYVTLLVILLSTVFVFAAVNSTYVIVVFFILFSYLIFYIIQKRKTKLEAIFALKNSIILLFLWFFLNLWWIMPTILFVTEGIKHAAAIGGTTSVFKVSSSQSSFINIFRLLGYWPFSASGWGGDPYIHWASIYSTIPFLILGFILPILALLPFLSKQKNRIIFYFGILLLLGSFLMKGMHPPLGSINKWMFLNIPLFVIFRNPYEKFGIIVVLSYAVLVGMGFGIIYGFLKKYSWQLAKTSILILYILFFGIYMWPYWTGDLIPQKGKISPGAHIRIPDYYYEAGRYISNQSREFKILSLPHQEGAAYNWRYGYFGSDDLLHHFLQKPLLARTINTGSIIDPYLSNLFSLFDKTKLDKNINQLLGITNIRYILVHNDINYFINTPNPHIKAENIKSILETQKGIHLEKSFGKLDLYKISDKYFLPHIYPALGIIVVMPRSYGTTNEKSDIEILPDILSMEDEDVRNGIFFSSQNEHKMEFIKHVINNSYDFKKKILITQEGSKRIYLGPNIKTPIIEFKKINPTKYRIRVYGATEDFPLIFSESYDEGWKAYVMPMGKRWKTISDKQKDAIQNDNLPAGWFYETWGKARISDDYHWVVNGYANSWWINLNEIKKDGGYVQNPDGSIDFELVLEFWPQQVFYLGLLISGLTLLLSIAFLLRPRRKTGSRIGAAS